MLSTVPRIRRVRCDEQKPACNRCVSTGRKCDGYVTDPSHLAPYPRYAPSSSTSSTIAIRSAFTSTSSPDSSSASYRGSPLVSNAAADLRLQFLQCDPAQTRSFRYFLTVAAPAIAGTFNTSFWTEEIPRACHEDPAIWHAIVSLGTVYEDHVAQATTKNGNNQPYRNLFALEQFNQSVQHLINPGLHSTRDKWRALITSTVFTSVCMVEGLYEQAQIHFKAGCDILHELEAREKKSPRKSPPMPYPEHERGRIIQSRSPTASPMPVSVSSIRSVLVTLEVWVQGMANNGIISMPALLFPEDPIWSLWEKYSAPRHSDKQQKMLTIENLTAANRAVESLLFANILFTHRNGKQFQRLFIERTVDIMETIAAIQRPLVQSFKELYKAMVVFGWELDGPEETDSESVETAQLRLCLYFLSIYVATNRVFIVPLLNGFGLTEGYASFPAACSTIVCLAEKICDLEASVKLRSRQTFLIPHPPLTTPLSIVAVVGPTADLRRRAIKIIGGPRIEGFLDGPSMASLSQAVLAGEAAADKEHQQRTAVEGFDTDPALKGYVPVQDEVHPLSRSYSSGFASSRRGEGVVQIRTWRDEINGYEGRKIKVSW